MNSARAPSFLLVVAVLFLMWSVCVSASAQEQRCLLLDGRVVPCHGTVLTDPAPRDPLTGRPLGRVIDDPTLRPPSGQSETTCWRTGITLNCRTR